MYEIVFDIETNAITDWDNLSDLKVIHCLALKVNHSTTELYSDSFDGSNKIKDGIRKLELSDRLIGHNIKRFDIPAIKKLYPDADFSGCHVIDTFLAGKIGHPDVLNEDYQSQNIPKDLWGRHSLEAWGLRLGCKKDDFGKETDWSVFTPEMGEYCKQDVDVNSNLWMHLKEFFSGDAYRVEDAFDTIIRAQESHGVYFDEQAAQGLHAELVGEKSSIERELKKVFPAGETPMKKPQYYYHPATEDRYNTKGSAPTAIRKELVAGPPKVKVTPFNPGSRVQIAEGLKKLHGWKPKEFTADGRAKVDESVLTSLDYPEAETLCRYLTVSKRLGQLSDGKEAWLRVVRDGKIHGRVNTIGTVSSRCTHSKPNLAQVPSVGAPWGTECRALFGPKAGYVLVGCDMSGLELRCLAHYLARYDKGEYASVIEQGDIHQFNADKMGVKRSTGKGIMYATLYGAGDLKIGSLVGGGKKDGKELRAMLEKGIPALKRLKNAIKKHLEKQNWLPAIDGRRLPIRSEHSALNLLLQSAGSILMKRATVLMNDKFGSMDVQQLMHIHDEVQLQAKEGEADYVGQLAVHAMRESGEHYDFRCKITGEYKIGRNWADTH